MSHYDDIRNRIYRQMIPLPILFCEDYSIDHEGLAKFVAWQMENGSKNFCLTFTYSQLDFVTPQEIVELTTKLMEVIRDDAVFIACTGGGSVQMAIDTVRGFERAGAQAAFVHMPEHCLQNANQCGEIYVRYISEVARQTTIPLLAVALGVPGTVAQPALTPQLYEELCNIEQFIGIKDDIYVLDNRLALTRKFGGRMGITGGGMFSQYIHFHHWPDQGEFSGMHNPKRGLRMDELLDDNDYLSVLKMMEEDSLNAPVYPPGCHWMARNNVVYYGMGFAESYQMRPPLVSATPQQAQTIIDDMHTKPLAFERVTRS